MISSVLDQTFARFPSPTPTAALVKQTESKIFVSVNVNKSLNKRKPTRNFHRFKVHFDVLDVNKLFENQNPDDKLLEHYLELNMDKSKKKVLQYLAVALKESFIRSMTDVNAKEMEDYQKYDFKNTFKLILERFGYKFDTMQKDPDFSCEENKFKR